MYPNAVIPVSVGGKAVKENIIANSQLFIVVYLAIVFISTLLLSALGIDNLSAFSGTVAAMGNVGPGLGTVGSMANYNHLSLAAKWILSIVMLLGRVEIYALFLIFTKAQWRNTISY